MGSGEDVVVSLFEMALFRGRFSFGRTGLLKLGVKEGRKLKKKSKKSNRQARNARLQNEEPNGPTLGDELIARGGDGRFRRKISSPLLEKTLGQVKGGKLTPEALEARRALKILEGARRLSEKLRSIAARCFEGAAGRFTSPDLISGTSTRLVDPANTMNKYAMLPTTRSCTSIPMARTRQFSIGGNRGRC